MSRKKSQKADRSTAKHGSAGKQQDKSRLLAPRSLIILGGLMVTLVLIGVLVGDAMSGTSAQSVSAPATEVEPQERPAPELPAAPIEFDPPSIDFGQVRRNTEHEIVVEARNTSNRMLDILTTRSSCTCTTTRVDATQIPPGGAVQFFITMDSQDRPGQRTVNAQLLLRGYRTAQLPVFVNVLPD